MALGLQAGGDFWGSSSSYDVAAPGDNTMAGQTASETSWNDSWSGMWNTIGAPLLNYAIQRDAAKNGLVTGGTASQGSSPQQPVYQLAAPSQAIPPVILFAGLGLLAYAVLKA